MPAVEQSGLVQRITEISEQAVQGTDIEIVEVQLKGAGKARLLRLYIDKPGGVTHGDCQLVSERLGGLLDEADVIPDDSYTLEVSSPGVERKLTKPRDFERVVGQSVRVTLKQAIEGQLRIEGKLLGIRDERLELEYAAGSAIEVELSNIQKANLKFKW